MLTLGSFSQKTSEKPIVKVTAQKTDIRVRDFPKAAVFVNFQLFAKKRLFFRMKSVKNFTESVESQNSNDYNGRPFAEKSDGT